MGERPDYFVPGDPPLALLGCARLGVSGKRVEFSGNLDRLYRAKRGFYGRPFLCINPAYNGRGHPGIYIPTRCKLDRRLARFAVHSAEHPQQAVRRYAYVVWGTAPAVTKKVEAFFDGGVARAAVFSVPAPLAREFGERPFALFVLELPLRAACASITVQGNKSSDRVGPRRSVCERA